MNWAADKLKPMDRKTRKMMTMNGALHQWVDMDRLYVTGGKGGRGWMSVKNVVKVEEHSLSDYLKRAMVISDVRCDPENKKRNKT